MTAARHPWLKPEDLARALIIGQIAGLFAKGPALKGKIAHKGAAMLHLATAASACPGTSTALTSAVSRLTSAQCGARSKR